VRQDYAVQLILCLCSNALSQIMTEDEKLTLDDSSSQLDSDAMKLDSNDTPIG